VLIKLIFLFCYSITVIADQQSNELEKIQQQAIEKKLAFHPEWLRLLHYQETGFISTAYTSYVDDDAFFFAQTGKKDPEAELLATLLAFSANVIEGDQHVICRYPARFKWLKNQLSLPEKLLPKLDCSAYQKWLQEVDAQRINLIFASAYLNSPSSMFGHTLLRLDPENKESNSNWLSYALNFGANVQEQDNGLIYSFKGLAGGYPGLFVVMPYFKKIQEYGFMENRDLWEYELNLDIQETEQLLSHLWELKNINFDYYFIGENCSFRLLELLEIARPSSDLTTRFKMTAIPSDTLKAVVDNGFIDSVHYRPSQAVILQQQIDRVPEQYHALVEQLSTDSQVVKQAEFLALEQDLRREIVKAAYKFLRYQTTGSQRDPVMVKHRFKLLSLLNSYPAAKQNNDISPAVPVHPDAGHDSHLASLAVGYERDQVFTDFIYRQNYHDLLDNPAGYFSGAKINFLDTRLRLFENGDFRLQKLEFLNITSISPRNRFFKPISWRISTGLEHQNNLNDKLTVYAMGGAGLSYQFFENSLSYNFVNAILAHSSDLSDFVEPGLGVTVGQLFYSDFGTSKLEFDSRNYLDGNYHFQLGLEHNFNLSTNQAVRVSVKQEWNRKESFNHAQVAYRLYF
jgi:hypothetical protein